MNTPDDTGQHRTHVLSSLAALESRLESLADRVGTLERRLLGAGVLAMVGVEVARALAESYLAR